MAFYTCTGEGVGFYGDYMISIMALTTYDADFFFFFLGNGKSSVKLAQGCMSTMSGKWSLTSVFGFLVDDIFSITKMFLRLIWDQ